MIPNAPIGLWPGLEFEGESIDTIQGRPLFIYTDGLNEAENPREDQGDRSMIAAKLHITRPVPVILPFSQHSEQHPACNNKRGTLDGVSRFCYLRIPNRWKLFGGT